jgi:putative membrane protein
MFDLLVRWSILGIAVAVSAWLLPGVRVEDANGVLTIAVMAAVLGILNALVRPVLVVLSCGCIVLTLGLFVVVIDAAVYWMASWASENWFQSQFHVDNFWWAMAGAIITSIVAFPLELILGRDD